MDIQTILYYYVRDFPGTNIILILLQCQTNKLLIDTENVIDRFDSLFCFFFVGNQKYEMNQFVFFYDAQKIIIVSNCIELSLQLLVEFMCREFSLP